MTNSIQNVLLGDRVLIGAVSDTFVTNIQLRLKSGVSGFKLENANIEPVFCSSINKHTCACRVSNCPEVQYLVFDEHHIQLLGAMDLLFYMYGQNDFKQPIFSMIMVQIIKTPKKRLYNIAAILLSEKCMLAANSTRALQYLAQLEENVITSEDYSGDTGEFDLNWFLLKSHRAEIAHSFVMNFYVYHELAHIKARQDPHAFSVYSSAVSVVSDSLELESPDFAKIFKVPDEELACDVYALDLLFDYVMNAGGDYYYEFMVESYIIAITNLTIMDSISVLTSIEEQYNNSWLRIIVALDALGFYKDMICNIPNFGKTIHRCRKYCYMKYRNYLKEMMCALQMLEAKFGDVLEKYPPFSKEWEEEKRTAISILASIK